MMCTKQKVKTAISPATAKPTVRRGFRDDTVFVSISGNRARKSGGVPWKVPYAADGIGSQCLLVQNISLEQVEGSIATKNK
jgi:hypothetical protein